MNMSDPDRPAFPVPIVEQDGIIKNSAQAVYGGDGMTLREYYAGLALQSILAKAEHPTLNSSNIAEAAVICADALLEELDKYKETNPQ